MFEEMEELAIAGWGCPAVLRPRCVARDHAGAQPACRVGGVLQLTSTRFRYGPGVVAVDAGVSRRWPLETERAALRGE
jgi:hypothetical protein